MAYRWTVYGHVFFVRWKALAVADLDAILRDMKNARTARSRPLVYISVVPKDLPVPAKPERDGLMQFGTQAKEFCESAYLVVEGDSVKHSLQRTVMTGLMFFMQQAGFRFQIHRTLDDALRMVSDIDVPAMLMELRARGLLQD